MSQTITGTSGKLSKPPFNSGITQPVNDFISNRNTTNYDVTRPKAYLNYVLLDDQMKPVLTNDGKNSGFDQVGGDQVFTTHQITNREITKNGYLYVYVSNESQLDVFFDNLQISQLRGPLMEETHYYPFGLAMAGISYKLPGSLANKFKYNGIELNEDLGVEDYDAHFRTLDPQTGRWWQIDPKIEQGQEIFSPYNSMSDNPILRTDPLGDLDDECCKEVIKDLKSAFKETATSAYEGAVSVARTFNTYVNPIASIVEVVTGKSTESDFTDDKPRSVSGMEAAMSILPGAKLEGAIIKAEVRALDKSIVKEVTGIIKEVNANSKASTKLNTLYKLESSDGKYLKTGITSQANIEKRYTKGFLQDKKMTPLAQGSRAEMLKKERAIVEKNPGPLNKEPWAGKQQN